MRTLREKLLTAFDVEQRQILASLRSHALLCEQSDQPMAANSLDESLRMAHTLKGASRVVDLSAVVQVAHEMESFFSEARTGKIQIQTEAARSLLSVLDTLEDLLNQYVKNPTWTSAQGTRSEQALGVLQELRKGSAPSKTSVPESAIPPEGKVVPAETSPAAVRTSSEVEMIRVNAESLDRLLATAGELCVLLQKSEEGHYRRLSEQLRSEIQEVRWMSVEGILEGLPSMIRDLARKQGKNVEVRVYGQDLKADKLILTALRAPLIHILQNCVSHGIETAEVRRNLGKNPEGRISLSFRQLGQRLHIVVEDDGQGLNWAAIQKKAQQAGGPPSSELERSDLAHMIFQSGFTTTIGVNEVSGRGMGLSVVHETMLKLKGTIEVDTRDRMGTQFVLSVPVKAALDRLLLCESQGQVFAIPFGGIDRLLHCKPQELKNFESHLSLFLKGVPLRIVSLASLLNLATQSLSVADPNQMTIAVIKSGIEVEGASTPQSAIAVDRFLGEGNFLVKEIEEFGDSRIFGTSQRQNEFFLGAVILDQGQTALVLNPEALLNSKNQVQEFALPKVNPLPKVRQIKKILVVDDSITTRTLEKGILEANGFQVELAVNGAEGLKKLNMESFDLVISDVEMPIMDGFTLLTEIKKAPHLAQLPVIMVTSRDSLQEQEKGRQLGATQYLVKQKFDQTKLLDSIKHIV